MVNGRTAHEIKIMIKIALGQLDRKRKAEGIKRAFACCMILLTSLEESVRVEDKAVYDEIREGTDWRGKSTRFTDEETRAQLVWLSRRYPQIAQALELGSAILDIIEQKNFYREYGFTSNEQWYKAIDDEAYLLRLKSLVA